MDSLDTLIARLEAADEGSRELDVEIEVAIGRGRPKAPYVLGRVSAYSRSLDAALTLVPGGARLELQNISTVPDGVFGCVICCDYENDGPVVTGGSYSPALAFCIAAIKAIQAQARQTAPVPPEDAAQRLPGEMTYD